MVWHILCRASRTAIIASLLALIAIPLTSQLSIAADTGPGIRARGGDLHFHWNLLRNDDDSQSHHARWTITNNGSAPLPRSGWTLYFNQLHFAYRDPVIRINSGVEISHINGDLMQLRPTKEFQEIPAGGNLTIEYHGRGLVNKVSWAPSGLYLVFEDATGQESAPELIGKVTAEPLTRPEQINRGKLDQTPIPTPEFLHRQNQSLTRLAPHQISQITPTPVSVHQTGKVRAIDGNVIIRYAEGLAGDAGYLANHLRPVVGTAPRAEPGNSVGQNVILLEIGPVNVAGDRKESGSEAYRLDITESQGIRITGADADGVFYGIQSLLQLLPPASFGRAYADTRDDITLPVVTVEDAPRFAYRGQHIDVSHNFHSQDSILKLLDMMAFYKMNRFHFQVSDDEGWRIEIPEIPELTEVSGGRAHTRDHDGVVHPIYGSGPYRYPETFGSGFYTRQQFIDILRHAKSLHIEVIPEINLPAHARGALIAMKAREKRLMSEGKTEEALKFRLHDPDDRSQYFSAQSFKDNCVCVVDEPVYHFADTIIRNFQEMFAEADLPLKTWHFGADEVPNGVWTESPRCAEYLRKHPELSGPADLKNYFVRRILKVIEDRGLRAASWQEAALDHVESGGTRRDVPRPEFSGGRLVSYVWNNTGGNEDLCNRFANTGYPVVLCSVTNLYYDLAYNKDPLEPGLTWAGFVDAKSPFVFVPENVFLSTRIDEFGKAMDRAAMEKNRERLTETGLKNVQGIQGQIWCETIKGPQMLEYYVFPKLISLAERAWAARPEWAGISDLAQHDAAVDSAWNEFANRLGQRELSRLDFLSGGIGYRLPPPGAQIVNGQLHASSEYPGLTMRYTTDGSAPTTDSPLYQGPVKISSSRSVRISTFSSNGRAGRSSVVSVP